MEEYPDIDDEWADYESGPFCANRHFQDPWDCHYECKRCGKQCHEHNKAEDACDDFQDDRDH